MLRCHQLAYAQYASFLRLAYEDLSCAVCTSYLSTVPKITLWIIGDGPLVQIRIKNIEIAGGYKNERSRNYEKH